ncbi:MAG: hypothetical protein JWO60_3100, partial [Frankiales bacterium]|nr:hypothetical protein [Frankiales bacterium]
MTTTLTTLAPCAALPVPTDARTDVELALDQLRGIEAWTAAHRCPLDEPRAVVSREERLDLARRRDIVDRQRRALHEWTAQQLQHSGALLHR